MNINLIRIPFYLNVYVLCLMSMLYVVCSIMNYLIVPSCRCKTSSNESTKFTFYILSEQMAVELGNIAPCKMCLDRDMGTNSPAVLRFTNTRKNSWVMRIRYRNRVSVALLYSLALAVGGIRPRWLVGSPSFYPFLNG